MQWEECYQEGHTPWDLGEPAPPLLEILDEQPGAIWGEGAVLVPGCGRGYDAAALHAASVGGRILGLDLAPTALEEARDLHGDPEGLDWVMGDFFDAGPAADHEVTAIWEHTCFCAIDPDLRPDYVEAAARWLPPGGRLVALFFLDPPGREDGDAGPPYGATIPEIRQLFAGRFEFVREALPGRSYPARSGREWVAEMVRTT